MHQTTYQNKKLRIVIIGYFGKLNAGDDLLQSSLCHIFQNHDLLFTSWFPGIDLLNLADLVIVGGGSIWPGNTFFQHGKELARRLKVPLIVLGISTKDYNPTVLEQTKPLIDKALFFHVRDNFSRDTLGAHPKIYVGTDLYWWCEHEVPRYPEKDTNVVSLNLRHWPDCIGYANNIVNSLNEYFDTILPFPFYFGSAQPGTADSLTDRKLLKSLLPNTHVPATFSTECLNTCSITVAMRFHAILVSIRTGLPTLGFDYHHKTKSFFDENAISELCVPLNDTDKLVQVIKILKNNYQQYESVFNEIKSRNETQGKLDLKVLMKIIETVEPRSNTFRTRIMRFGRKLLRS